MSRTRQEFFQFFDHEGKLSGYSETVRKDSALARYKIIALASHLDAQKAAFSAWLQQRQPMHCIFTRIYDDTNVFVSPERGTLGAEVGDPIADQQGEEEAENGEAEDEQFEGRVQGRTGRRKVSPLLGMLQWVTVRQNAASSLETVQLHVPSRVLPKAGQPGNRADL